MNHNTLPVDVLDNIANSILDNPVLNENDDIPAVFVEDEGSLQVVALQLWLYQAGRDMRTTQTMLFDKTGVMVPMNQLQEWRRVGNWGEFFHLVHQKVVSNARDTIQAMQSVASVDALRYLHSVVRGDDPDASASTRVKAAMTVLDRFGYPTLLRGEMLGGMNVGVSDSFADMSDDDLEAEWRTFNADGEEVEPQVEQDIFTARMNNNIIHAATPR